MFRELSNFALTRTPLQAFGFYIAYLLLMIVIGALIGVLAGAAVGGESSGFDPVIRVASIFASIACGYLSYVILTQKNRATLFVVTLCVTLSALLGFFGGGLLGLLIPAYLTTREPATTTTS